MKKRIYEILEKATPGDIPSRIFDIFIISLIFLNILAMMLETVKSFSMHQLFFRRFEIFSIVVFTVEYTLRVWSCTSNPEYSHPVKGRLKFMTNPYLIIDLFAFLPFYIPFLIPIDLRFLRIFRLFRIFRIFKLGRYSKSVQVLIDVLKSKKEELLITVFTISMLLISSACVVYYCEKGAQPAVFTSIPQSIWWAVATLTTVGYGDIYPITPAGKFFASIISLLGIGLFGLPAGILASGFIEQIQKEKIITCPFCKKEFKI